MKAELIWPVAALLGEGPVWRADRQELWFTDIKGRRLHRYQPSGHGQASFDLPGEAGFVVPAPDDALVLGMGRALYRRGSRGDLSRIGEVPTPWHNRINDGTTAPDGSIWFGTMDDGETRPTGNVYRFDGRTGGMSIATPACTIVNGPAIGGDGGLIYHVDTLAGIIWRAEIAPDGSLHHTERFAAIAPADGNPDGVTIDAAGGVWVGLWGGWALRRYDAAGHITHQIALPCANVTKVAFGGADLCTGFVTTARVGLNEAALATQALAGGLFGFAAPYPGLVCPQAAMPISAAMP